VAAHVRQRSYQREDEEAEWSELGRAYLSGASPLVVWPMVTGQTYTTGIGRTADLAEALGVIPCREFYWWSPLAVPGGALWVYTDNIGVAWVTWADGDSIHVSRLTHQRDLDATPNTWAEPSAVGEVAGVEAVGITGDGRALRVLAVASGVLWESWSRDRGRTWSTFVEVA